MSNADHASLQAVHDQLSGILEDRVTELMTQIKTAQALSRQIARTEEEIERQQLLKEKLEGEIGPLTAKASALRGEVEALQASVDSAGGAAARLAEIKAELEALQG